MTKMAGILLIAASLTVLVSTTGFAQNASTTFRNSDVENIGNRDINKHDINFLSRDDATAVPDVSSPETFIRRDLNQAAESSVGNDPRRGLLRSPGFSSF
jgi:hypothetical protein